MLNIRDYLIRLQSHFVDSEVVAAYRTKIPDNVTINYKKDGDYYIAYLEDVDGEKIKGLLITQGKNPEELLNNLNQLVYTHVKLPEKVRPYYGNMYEFDFNGALSHSKKLTLQKA